MHKLFCSAATATKISKNGKMLEVSLETISRERAEMDKYFNKCIEALELRRKVHHENFDTQEKVHHMFLQCTDMKACQIIGAKVQDDLIRSVNTRKLEDVKSSVPELLEVAQMLLTMQTKLVDSLILFVIHQSLNYHLVTSLWVEYWIFVNNYPVTSSIRPPQVHACVEVNYTDKGGSTSIIPVSGATGDSRLTRPAGVAYCSHTNTILMVDGWNSRVLRYDMDGGTTSPPNFIKIGEGEENAMVTYMCSFGTGLQSVSLVTLRALVAPQVVSQLTTRVMFGVAWFDHHRVDVFNPQGEIHSTFGRQGNGPTELRCPRGLELLPDGRLVVCDSDNHRL